MMLTWGWAQLIWEWSTCGLTLLETKSRNHSKWQSQIKSEFKSSVLHDVRNVHIYIFFPLSTYSVLIEEKRDRRSLFKPTKVFSSRRLQLLLLWSDWEKGTLYLTVLIVQFLDQQMMLQIDISACSSAVHYNEGRAVVSSSDSRHNATYSVSSRDRESKACGSIAVKLDEQQMVLH